MTENAESIKSTLKEYVLSEFLPGEDPDALEDDTPLITGGIMDSIATVKFSLFVEEKFGVELQAHHSGEAPGLELVGDLPDDAARPLEVVLTKIQRPNCSSSPAAVRSIINRGRYGATT